MSLILLHRPIASSDKLERVHLFAGRHLGEEEFERQQHYADARLLPLLRRHPTGVVQGLRLSSSGNGDLLAHETFIVNPGQAVTTEGQTLNLQMPLRAEWQAMIERYLIDAGVSDATGFFYLTLHQTQSTIDSPTVDPCQRAEFDPTRDSRLVTVTSVRLRRLALAPELVETAAPELIQNIVAADRVDGVFLAGYDQSVPLALLSITTAEDTHTVNWVSEEAGRYEARKHGGYRVLLNQTSAALRAVMLEHARPENAETPLAAFLDANLELDYLPAAGQLPLSWLQNPDSLTPNLLWLPDHLGIDMVPVPSDSVLELINRHLPRRVIDLRQPGGDKLRLMLALDRKHYRPDLLDIPPTDLKLESDLYRFYMRAYMAWHRWRQQFDTLYFVEPSNEEPLDDSDELAAIEHAVLDPAQFKQLGLPKPTLPPLSPVQYIENVVNRAMKKQDVAEPADLAYPYNEKDTPTPPAFYNDWLETGDDGNQVPPVVEPPQEDGLVIQYAVAQVELDTIENQIRAIRTRLEKTRDFVMLQRQQLDSQTVALSALAGGVAGDGNGLQVARWLPYASLNTNLVPQELTTPATKAAPTTVASSVSRATVENARLASYVSAPYVSAPYVAAPMTFAASSNYNYKATSTPAASYKASSPSIASFSNNLLSSALNTNVKNTVSVLSSKPQSFSAFELGINKQRLDLLANLSKAAVSKPAFEAREFRFGVLDHISPEINEYNKAYFGMQDLLATITDLFDPTDASALRKQLQEVMKYQSKEGSEEESRSLVAPRQLEADINKRANEMYNAADPETRPTLTHLRGLVANQKRYEALFIAGKVLTQWIAICEARYNQIERKMQGKLREHSRKLAQLEKLSGLIRVAREALENMDRYADEQVGDYGVAQRLIEEDWQQAHDANIERSRILTTAVQGLYYVRVRNTPVSLPLADPLSLRYKSKSDIVPGCDWETDIDLPSALESFFSTVTEIPMDDWVLLRPLKTRMPPFEKFDYIGKLRDARFKARPLPLAQTQRNSSDTLQVRLNTVHLQTQPVIKQWAALTLPVFLNSSLQTQSKAAKVLSLEDMAQGGSGELRKEAQVLRERLEQCQYCLLEKLAMLPGSIRLQWGQLAEDDRINVQEVSRWPGLELAEADDFNATRTIAELIDWWFRQLTDDADAATLTAMRNMVRATLIFASLGDPQEIVRGTVHVPPKFVLPGERFRVKLNRNILPGMTLQLLDLNQQVAAELAVEDHSPDTTQVRILSVIQPSVKITSQFAVVGKLRK